MDIRECYVCGKTFDLDINGSTCGDIVVCSDKCKKINKPINTDMDGRDTTYNG